MFLYPLSSIIKKLFSSKHSKEMETLGISSTLLKQAKKGDDKAQLEIASHYFSSKQTHLLEKAVYWLKLSANNNNPDAMFSLATLYYRGIGVQQNLEQSIHWYQQAAQLGQTKALTTLNKVIILLLKQKAEQHDNDAMYELANHYTLGEIVESDHELARQWYEKAITHGHIKACVNLATLYDKGLGIPKNTERAALLYLQAAKQNNDTAMLNIGILYLTGEGVKKDINEAIYWFNKAALLGHAKAIHQLNTMQLEQYAQRAAKGDRQAIKNYINLCATSTNKIDNKQLINWLYKAADQGDSDAMVDIGNFFAHGTPPVQQDYQQAMEWFLKANELNNNQAMNLIGLAYLTGQGVTKNFQTAIQWFEQAASSNNDKAMVNLANFYLTNSSYPNHYQQAFTWFNKAAKCNNNVAMQSLSYLYQHGLGTVKDLEKAKYWQQQSKQALATQ